MKLSVLFGKARRAFLNGGITAVAKQTKNYVVFRVKAGLKTDEMRDILFVNGCTLPHPERYRVDHQMEQLEACGLSVEKVMYDRIDLSKIKFYRAIIVFRCPITEDVKKLVETAHYFNKKVFFDIDDLVIDKKYTDKIDYVAKMNKEDKAVYDDGVVRMGETMKLCDYCITTTPALARELEKYGKEVYVNRNVASEKMVKYSLDALKTIKKDPEKIRIGYLSGSITHNPDFEMIKPALIKIMDEFSNVELVVMGYLDLPKDLDRFSDRIERQVFKNWEKLPEVIASLDINLAPIEKSIFNEAKSENKWTEAALCKVVTVASDFGAFKEIIKDNETGMLCNNGEDWYKKIKDLIVDKEKRKKIAKRAHEKVLKEHVTTYTGLGVTRFIKSKLAKNIGFVLPSTNISGGVNVVLKHCEILRKNGYDVMAINMDVSDDDFENKQGVVSVVSGEKHDIAAKFDGLVATLYTTLEYVKKFPDAKKKFYLVQNFETNFSEYGLPSKREANATYVSDSGINYITISKWCKKWLEEEFGQKVKYAPNGLDLTKFDFKERKIGEKVKILIEGNSDDYYKNVDESFKVVEKLDPNKYEIHYLSYQGKPKKWYRVDKFYHRVPYDEVGKVYSECDVLLKTSILESFSYPPLEMMATGGFVVAVPNAGNVEYLKDKENCLFYEQGNIDEAVNKIEMIASDANLRKKLSDNAKKVVQSRDWNKIEKKILELYS